MIFVYYSRDFNILICSCQIAIHLHTIKFAIILRLSRLIAIMILIALSSRTVQSFQEPCVTQIRSTCHECAQCTRCTWKKRVFRVHHRRLIQETRGRRLLYTQFLYERYNDVRVIVLNI